MSLPDMFGWLAYLSMFYGTFLVSRKLRRGWLLRLSGDVLWAIIGLYIGMVSIAACSIIFAVIDFSGWLRWEDTDRTEGRSTD